MLQFVVPVDAMNTADVDYALVRRVQAGEMQAFNLLINKYQHKIIKLITRFVQDPDEAQDVAQEAFIKAYRALKDFRGDSAFYTWLYRIAVNTAKNHLVARRRRPPAEDVEVADAERYASGAALQAQSSPERELLTEEIGHTVAQAMAQLPEDLYTAITLRELEGLSYEQIAQAMDCPIGTVRSRIFRAREAVEKRLRPLLT